MRRRRPPARVEPARALSRIERLRRVATPQAEVEEFFADMAPATVVDSQIRELFTRLVQQAGPFTIDMEVPNTGMAMWEEAVYNPSPGIFRRMVTVWHQDADSG